MQGGNHSGQGDKQHVDETSQSPVHSGVSSPGCGQSQGRAQWGWSWEQKLERGALWGEAPQGDPIMQPGLRTTAWGHLATGQGHPGELLQNTSLAPLQTHSSRCSRMRPGPRGKALEELPRWFWCTVRVENHCPKSGIQEWQQDLLHRTTSFYFGIKFHFSI